MDEVTTRPPRGKAPANQAKAAPIVVPPDPLGFQSEREALYESERQRQLIKSATRPDSQGKPDLLSCLQTLEGLEREVGYHCDATKALLQGVQALITQDIGDHPAIASLIDLAQNQMEVLANYADSAVAGEGAWTTTGRDLARAGQIQVPVAS